MSPVGPVRRALPASTWVLAAVVGAGPVVALELGRVAGHRPGLPWLLAVLAPALAWAWRPGAWFGTMAVVVVVAWWAQAVRDDLPLAAVGAACCLVAAHVAALILDLGPPRMPADPGVLRLWLERALAAAGAAGVLWLVATAAEDVRAPGVWVLALLVGLVAAVAATAVLSRSNTS